jgi:hypothetical protein
MMKGGMRTLVGVVLLNGAHYKSCCYSAMEIAVIRENDSDAYAAYF